MNVHMTLGGNWAVCKASARPCPRKFHLPNVTAAEAAAMPKDVLAPLLNLMDPPSISYKDGTQAWLLKGMFHRDYDLPAILDADGMQRWYCHGKLHRANNRPAVLRPELGGSTASEWWVEGLRHREDGPAVIYAGPDGTDIEQWWLRGKQLANATEHASRVYHARVIERMRRQGIYYPEWGLA